MIFLNHDIFYIILEFSLFKDIINLLILNKFIYINNRKIINSLLFKEKQIRYYYNLDIINFLGVLII